MRVIRLGTVVTHGDQNFGCRWHGVAGGGGGLRPGLRPAPTPPERRMSQRQRQRSSRFRPRLKAAFAARQRHSAIRRRGIHQLPHFGCSGRVAMSAWRGVRPPLQPEPGSRTTCRARPNPARSRVLARAAAPTPRPQSTRLISAERELWRTGYLQPPVPGAVPDLGR